MTASAKAPSASAFRRRFPRHQSGHCRGAFLRERHTSHDSAETVKPTMKQAVPPQFVTTTAHEDGGRVGDKLAQSVRLRPRKHGGIMSGHLWRAKSGRRGVKCAKSFL